MNNRSRLNPVFLNITLFVHSVAYDKTKNPVFLILSHKFSEDAVKNLMRCFTKAFSPCFVCCCMYLLNIKIMIQLLSGIILKFRTVIYINCPSYKEKSRKTFLTILLVTSLAAVLLMALLRHNGYTCT